MKAIHKKILITGGAGFIGSHLVDECLRREWFVTVLDNLSSGHRKYIPSGATFIEADLNDLPKIDGYDYVAHLAAEPFVPKSFGNAWHFFQTNVVGTLNLLQACVGSSIKKIMVVSSSEIYGTSQMRPSAMNEDHPLNPQSTYGVTKLAADRLAAMFFHEQKLPTLVFRPFNVYGAANQSLAYGTQPYVINDIISQIVKDSEDVITLGNFRSCRDFSWVGDTVYAMAECLEQCFPGEAYNFGSGDVRSIESIVTDVCKLAGKPQVDICSDKSLLRPNDVTWLEADSSKLENVIGEVVRLPWLEGLARTIDWFKGNGYLWPWQEKANEGK